MVKHKFKLSVRIPEYQSPRNSWRQALHAIILSAANKAGVVYYPSDRLELKVKLYMDSTAISFHDIDRHRQQIKRHYGCFTGSGRRFKKATDIIAYNTK